jgi:hypothetical protein
MLITHGTHVDWDTFSWWSPAVDVLRSVRDHVEYTVNPFQRYKSHTTPSAEKDINELASWFAASEVFEYKKGRLQLCSGWFSKAVEG